MGNCFEGLSGGVSKEELWHVVQKDGTVDQVRACLAAGGQVNSANPQGDTALMMAAVVGKTELLKLLIENKAEVNRARADGGRALMMAASADVAKLLLENSAEVNAKDSNGSSAIDYAVNADIKKLLQRYA